MLIFDITSIVKEQVAWDTKKTEPKKQYDQEFEHFKVHRNSDSHIR